MRTHNGGNRIEVSLYRVGQGVGWKATWALAFFGRCGSSSRVGFSPRRVRALEVHLKFGSHGRSQAVEELAEVRAPGIVLHVARIEMVGDVENDDTGARLLVEERNFETFQDGRVQRQKSREAGLIANAHKFQPFIND